MGKIVVITGGSSGIGRAAAELFVRKGCTVYELSRSGKSGGGINHITADVTSEEDVTAAMTEINSTEGRIDLLINNAGMGISGAVEFTDLAAARRQMDVNFFGVFLSTKAALPYLRSSETPQIVNISSVGALFALPFQSFYSASKISVNTLTLSLVNELKPWGFRVSAIMPGDAATGFTEARMKSEAGEELYGKRIRDAVEGMERDERKGMTPEKLAELIFKVSEKKHPKPLYTAGGAYKLYIMVQKLLPARAYNWIVGKMYS